MRNWSDDEIKERGFDPATGARLGESAQSVEKPPLAARLSAAAISRLKPEMVLQVQVVQKLRPRLVPGARLLALNGELPGGTTLFQVWQTVRSAAGHIPGTPDLAVVHQGRVFWVELKRPRGEPDLLGHRKARGELSGEQRDWRDWARDDGAPWVCARSVAEVETALAEWGLLR